LKSLRTLALGLVFILLASSCATPGYVIEESNYSVKQHRIAITAALGLVRQVSQNGRTVLSLYHDKNFKNIEITPKTRERYFTRVTVLGAIRPFRVQVEVIQERRDPDTKEFMPVGLDEDLAEKRALVVQSMLNQSRDEGTTFDEESPF
jgi:hypothetical protein